MKIKPEEKIYCDVCKILMAPPNSTQNGFLKIGRDWLDFQGNACADAGVILNDVCDDCLDELTKTINKTAEKRQEIAVSHKGDPCIYCNTPHDDVPVGACSGREVCS